MSYFLRPNKSSYKTNITKSKKLSDSELMMKIVSWEFFNKALSSGFCSWIMSQTLQIDFQSVCYFLGHCTLKG